MRFLPDIPVGMSVCIGDEAVVGIQHMIDAAKAFASGTNHDIYLLRDPNNPHDRNAIRVIGTYNDGPFSRSMHIGYVDASTAKAIAERPDTDSLCTRLKNIWWGGFEKDFIVVEYDILQPKPPPKERKSKSTKN